MDLPVFQKYGKILFTYESMTNKTTNKRRHQNEKIMRKIMMVSLTGLFLLALAAPGFAGEPGRDNDPGPVHRLLFV